MSDVTLKDIEQAAKTILDAFEDWNLPDDILNRFQETYKAIYGEIDEIENEYEDIFDDAPALLYEVLYTLSGGKDE